MEIVITTDKEILDFNFIYTTIKNSYWGKDRTKAMMEKAIAFSLNFGMYAANQQIGYGRIITDYATLCYLLDVVIAEQYRNQQLGTALMRYILSYEPIQEVKYWRLSSTEARLFYARFGFTTLAQPANQMELRR